MSHNVPERKKSYTGLTLLIREALYYIAPYGRDTFISRQSVICSIFNNIPYTTVRNWLYGNCNIPRDRLDDIISHLENRISYEQDLLVRLRNARLNYIQAPGHFTKKGI